MLQSCQSGAIQNFLELMSLAYFANSTKKTTGRFSFNFLSPKATHRDGIAQGLFPTIDFFLVWETSVGGREIPKNSIEPGRIFSRELLHFQSIQEKSQGCHS